MCAASGCEVPEGGDAVWELHPHHALVGHFAEDDMPPTSILMQGYHGANIRNVAIRMMVDELLGPVAASGASHGYTAVGTEPVRWIEAQAPLPPASHGFFFHDDWATLEQVA